MKKLLSLVAIAEGAAGVALMVVPSPVGRLLVGVDFLITQVFLFFSSED
jgi:hypothetical protein